MADEQDSSTSSSWFHSINNSFDVNTDEDVPTFWSDHWIMIISTSLALLMVLVFLLSPSRASFLRNPFSSSGYRRAAQQQQQSEHPQQAAKHEKTNWLEDAQYIQSFGELHNELNSEHSQHLLREYYDSKSDDDSSEEPSPRDDVTHFLFLVHGFHGFSKDLGYLETVLRLMVDREKHRLASNHAADKTNKSNGGRRRRRQDMVVHCPTCNEHRTKDGVIDGGDRLWNDMLETIRSEMTERSDLSDSDESTPVSANEELKDITISLLGNSLGGLYCRYAVAKLFTNLRSNGDELVLDGQFRVHLNIFCTTASPHLGISKHTYIPIPRTAEIGVAHTMGDTGKDLFRLNDLLKTMATTPEYLRPLGQFRKRIAYANAYGTDFPVPTATAAFLHSKSTYPHHIVETGEASYSKKENNENKNMDDENDTDENMDDNGLVVAIFQTPSTAERRQNNSDGDALETGLPEHADDLAYMSYSLDSLGWKKVFVDLRKEISIGVNLPTKSSFHTPSFFDSSNKNDSKSAAPISILKRQSVVASRDVASATSVPPDLSRLSWPLGHNMIVAFARSPKAVDFNKGGRPIVDDLANELVEFIFNWESSEVGADGKDGDSMNKK